MLSQKVLLPVVRGLSTIAGMAMLATSLSAKIPPGPVRDSSYISALAAADHFLQAWQSEDIENGMVLLTSHAKESVSTKAVENFFSHPEPSAYEIDSGKMLTPGRYAFPIMLVAGAPSKARTRRRFSTIVVVNTGSGDWAVDKLP